MVDETLQATETIRNGMIVVGIVTFLLLWYGKIGLAIVAGVVFVVLFVAYVTPGTVPA